MPAIVTVLAYASGFKEMLQMYANTGKLGSLGAIGVLAGGLPITNEFSTRHSRPQRGWFPSVSW